MATGLQRSTTAFRRQGSSGMVWDDKFLSADPNKMRRNQDHQKGEAEFRELRPSRSAGLIGVMDLGRFPSGGPEYRTVKVSPPTDDPPSPKLDGCGFCGIFGKATMMHQRPKSNER